MIEVLRGWSWLKPAGLPRRLPRPRPSLRLLPTALGSLSKTLPQDTPSRRARRSGQGVTGEGSGGGRDKSKPLTLPQAARLAPERLLSLVLKVFKQQWRQVAHLLAVIANTAEASPSDGLESWLGPAPSDPVALELRSRKKRSRRRRVVLRRTIGADEVAERLQTRSRQTPHDRVRAGTLLAIRDNGHLRFPLCQFDPEGPEGVVAGLADVLQALDLPAVAQSAWLERPHSALGDQTPIAILKRGERERLVALAQRAGHGQD